ncbi:aminotransferase class V-fold PLP-dependent enzyme [Croceibacterium sp. TMG7-5b_MA50]|uniref:cysteine desulfurase family protein n=1 Tax=Croceibacterium sp. TMG7-5b_MA50 TaxID=3121290 RepID=UPI003221C7D3
MTRIYLDHAATTPLRPEARAALEDGWRLWANPSSPHADGRAARRALEDARDRIRTALGWTGELVFTSGASEAATLALNGAKAGSRLVSAVEHDAVLQQATGAAVLPVGNDGTLCLAALDRELQAADDPLVAVQSINSETGAAQDIAPLAAQVQEAGGLLMVDHSQGAGKVALPAGADLAIIAAHKFGGPVGVGALLVRDWAMLTPSGGQERGYRRGTENLPGALSMAAALEAALAGPLTAEPVDDLLADLAAGVRAAGGMWLGDRLAKPTPLIHALATPHLSATAQLMRLDLAGIAVSQGSACSSGSMRSSHVLAALGIADDDAARFIRISLGWSTTRADLQRFGDAWLAMARREAAA